MISNALSVLSAVIIFGSYVPYARDIVRGKVIPARSARIMFAILMLIALLQQHSLGSGWALAVTVGEVLGSLAILILALQKGIGGLSRLDIVCYLLLVASVVLWISTSNALLALHLTVLADIIAMAPTLVKTWHHPHTETALFYIAGIVAPVLSIIAAGNYAYAIILFPLYLAAINALEVGLIYRRPAHKAGDLQP